MKSLTEVIRSIRTKVGSEGNYNVRELEPLFSAFSGTDWKRFLEKEDGKPKNTILFQDQHLKILLIYWNPKQLSQKHGHPKGGGLFRVLSGQLLETRFDPENEDVQTGKHLYVPNADLAYIHDSEAMHVVENPADEPAVSLHLYSFGVVASNSFLIRESAGLMGSDLKNAA